MTTATISAPAPTSERDAFLAAITEGLPKGDTTPALLYADWCADRGEQSEATAALIVSGRSIDAAHGLPNGTVALANSSIPAGPSGPNAIQQYRGGVGALDRARAVVAWVVRNRAAVDRAAAEMRRRAAALEAAAQGDVDALLAHHSSRAAVVALAAGRKAGPHTVSAFVRSRKAIALAKARMIAREERRAARAIAESARRGIAPGKFSSLLLAKRRARAVALAEQYHREVARLYQSSRASVAYGRGGQEDTSREEYSKGWHNRYGPARWRNAGARLDDEARPTCVIIENYRGTEVVRLPL